MNDSFQNGGPFGMAVLRSGGPEPFAREGVVELPTTV